jgi:hypothetical protein
MNHLRLTQRFASRKKNIEAAIGKYWLDRLVEHIMSEHKNKMAMSGKIIAVLRDPLLESDIVIPGLNLVTNAGDEYYAESSVAETPTNDFDAAAAGFRLGTGSAAATKTDTDVTTEDAAGRKATDATYPRTSDPDGDNTGSGIDIVTWRVSYTTGEANITGIREGAICDNRTTPTAALTHFVFGAAFNKTSSDTLKIFANHEMLGV